MTGRTAVVTGAHQGIGRAVAERLAQDGWELVVTDRDPGVAELADTLGPRCRTVVGDVCDEGLQAELFDGIDPLAPLGALVNNAGVGGPGGPAAEITDAVLRHVLDINLMAPFAVAARAARLMIGNGGGRIVNMGSVFGQQAVPESTPYCVSKGAITQLTQSLAVDLGQHGITVNTVAPGYILTAMHEEEIEARAQAWGCDVETARRRTAESVPLRRHGTPQDIAAVVSWLTGTDSAYVTGQTIAVNGGLLLS